ncbi:HK97 family phage prohead protease [Microcella alkaliphila]|uniref:Capsid maturation protease n=1 Tax=Microcella alkaliphila TaxID=279828 RepID=A0A0U5BE09_9MICO|nr:HK97 family phage prohead protease [Microcella alkaliphila]BAU32463.1 capsid maturation protease [Microcella alkaliphila]
MFTKSFTARVKSIEESTELDDGIFEAIVAVFGNVDSYGDRILPGAFKDTLDEWQASGNPVPIYWSHRMDDPDYNIGHALELKELEPGNDLLPPDLKDLGGLWVRGQLDLEGSKARQVHRLMKGRRVTQFSFAYDLIDYAIVKTEEDDGQVWELRKLKLYEVGPTPIGANQETELLAVKHAGHVAARIAGEVKSGRVLSAKNEGELRDARDAIDRVLQTLDTDDDSKASGSEPVKAEESHGAKAEEPTRGPSALARLQIDLATAEIDHI